MKLKIIILSNIVSVFLLITSCSVTSDRYKDSSVPVEDRIEDLLLKLSLEEKISLLGGDSTGFNATGISRYGILPISMSDGPVGVRTGKATAFPVSVNMAASWDTALVNRYGIALAEETKAKGKICILGPCVGIHRFPLNGRNFESFGEDPFLSSRLVVNYIKGVQSQNVIATVKHFACNDQEWERNNTSSNVDERALREIHLPAFEAAVKEGHTWALMSSYNLVNGQHSSENLHLLNEVLKNEWGYKGIVMSDWVSVYSAVDAANNGLDLEMPNPAWFKDSLLKAEKAGKVLESVINDKVRRLLRVRFEAGYFDKPLPTANESIIHSDSHKALALEMAQKGVVLLKNDKVLPLSTDKIKRIALIGPSVKVMRTGGGGSSRVQPWEVVTPYDGIKTILGSQTEILYSEGILNDQVEVDAIPSAFLQSPDGKNKGLLGEYYNNTEFKGNATFTRIDTSINFDYGNTSPDQRIGSDNFSIRWTGKFIPPVSKKYHLTISSDDGSMLYINGKLVIDNSGNHAEYQKAADIELKAGTTYNIKIEYFEAGGGAAMRFGWRNPYSKVEVPSIADAVKIAKMADVAVVFVGNTETTESESHDVEDFVLPDGQDDLVKEVCKANPNTVVVLFGGTAIKVGNWLNDAKALIAAFYPGQYGGTALAQILFGQVNPSAKLPFSYIQDKSQNPVFKNYKDKSLKIPYSEGVYVGYRYYDKYKVEPVFPFGYGLSYTSFDYSNLKISKKADLSYEIKLDVKNTGKLAGEEVVELYVAPKNSLVDRPVKELKSFSKVNLKPGEVKTITMHLNARSFEYYQPEKHTWIADKGEYEIQIGASSRDIKLKDIIKL
jgi:beta-glucosidase